MADGSPDTPRRAAGVGRVPPHNLEAEESLLGAMLLSGDAIAAAVDVVSRDDFYRPAHGHIFDAITSLYGAGEPVDPVTVAEELRRADLLDAIGGPARARRPPGADAGDLERGALRAHRRRARAAAPAHRRRRRDRRARLQPARRRHQGRRPRRGDGVRRRPAPGHRHDRACQRPARRQPQPARGALRARRVDHRPRHRLQRPRRAAVGPAAVARSSSSAPARPWASASRATRRSSIRRPAPSARPPSCTGSASGGHVGRGRLARRRWLARVGRTRGVHRRRHQAGVPGAHPLGPRDPHDGRAPVPHRQGWQPLADLGVGIRVAVPHALPIFGDERLPAAEVVLLAHLVGHGHRVAGGTVFAQLAPVVVADLVVHADGHGVRAVPLAAGTPPTASSRSQEPRPDRGRRRAARLARCVERPRHARRGLPAAPRPAALFLARLLRSAGSARGAARGAGRIRYVTASRAMAHGVQHLLLRFGVASTVREKRVCEQGVSHDLFELEVTEASTSGRSATSSRSLGQERRSTSVARAGGAGSGSPSVPGRSGRAVARRVDAGRSGASSGRCSTSTRLASAAVERAVGRGRRDRARRASSRSTTSPSRRAQLRRRRRVRAQHRVRARHGHARGARSAAAGAVLLARDGPPRAHPAPALAPRRASTRRGCAPAGSPRPTGRRSATPSAASRRRRSASTTTRTSR